MDNMMDMLLSTDVKNLKRPRVEKEVKRLSEALGAPFVLELEALTVDEFSDIHELSVDSKTGSANANQMKAHTIVKAVKNIDFSDKDLLKKYEAYSSRDLVTKLFLPGEIALLYNSIAEIGGFHKDAVKTVKNS